MHKTLSKLFRDIESDVGTHSLCVMALGALKNAFLQQKIKTKEDFDHQLLLLFKLLQITKPRYAILLDAFYKILEAGASSKSSVEDLITKIDFISTSYQLEKLQLIQVSKTIDVQGKNILIHDHSHSIHSVLNTMKQDGKQFTVIVAEQDMEKTEDNIKFLHQHGIDYRVIPSYMLSHIEDTVDMVFCGAVTFQENNHFVMDTGSKPIISHFNFERTPVYLFLTTSKLTLWPLKKSHQVFSKVHKRHHHTLTDIEYDRMKFSHDRVELELINHIVTEKKIYGPTEFKHLFGQMFRKRAKVRKKYLKI